MTVDLVIRGGIVVDGTRMPRRTADIAIDGGRIVKIGRLPATDARKVIDADGQIVAPGFIDLHTHYDAQVFWDPYCSLSGWHGVTSVVIGNCGFGFAPVRPAERDRAMLSMTRVEAIPLRAMQLGMPWDWVTFPEFLDSIERTPKAVNVLAYVPVSALLIWVLGLERAKAGALPTDDEHREMKRLLHEAMDAGARGWSAQWMQAETAQRDFDGTRLVSDLLHDETVLQLADVLAERDDGFIQLTHSRVDGKNTDFFETLALRSGRPILFNTVVARPSDPSMHRSRLAWLADCRRRGLQIYGQGITADGGYTFSFDEWNLFDEMPAWREATIGTVEERLSKLSDPSRRPALREQRPWMALRSIEGIRVEAVLSARTREFVGRTVGEIAAETGDHPTDVLLDIATADGLQATFSSLPGFISDEGFRDLIQDDYIIPGISDGGAHARISTAGSYPTGTIIRAVRDEALLSLEDAHWRLSALPARCAGFIDRGTLDVGMAADVIVYDLEKLAISPVERVTDLPGGEWRRVQRGLGYAYVIVNGEVTMVDGKETDARSGALLRR